MRTPAGSFLPSSAYVAPRTLKQLLSGSAQQLFPLPVLPGKGDIRVGVAGLSVTKSLAFTSDSRLPRDLSSYSAASPRTSSS